MEGFEQSLHIDDSAFEKMREDADRVLQKLIKNMVEKESLEGKLTITIDLSLEQEFIPNYDPAVEGESRRVLIPKIAHKVGSMMQIKDESKGNANYDGMELVWDEDAGEYVMKPVANTQQKTIFDADFRCVNDPEDGGEVSDGDGQFLEGRRIAALPGPSTGEGNEPEKVEGEIVDDAPETDDTAEDLSDEFDNEERTGEPIPFSGDDDYGYEEPGEEY